MTIEYTDEMLASLGRKYTTAELVKMITDQSAKIGRLEGKLSITRRNLATHIPKEPRPGTRAHDIWVQLRRIELALDDDEELTI